MAQITDPSLASADTRLHGSDERSGLNTPSCGSTRGSVDLNPFLSAFGVPMLILCFARFTASSLITLRPASSRSQGFLGKRAAEAVMGRSGGRNCLSWEEETVA